MTYDLLVLVHVLAAIVWIGAGLMMLLLSTMADRSGDADTFGALVALNTRLGLTLFVPASLLVLVSGLAAVAAGPWSLATLWLVLALAGFAITFLVGGLVFKPRVDRLAALAGPDGRLGPAAMDEARALMTLARLDYVVLVLVVADMVLKPTGDDVATLGLMAAVLVAGFAAVLSRVPKARLA
jgi:uncharacterized membrane protein